MKLKTLLVTVCSALPMLTFIACSNTDSNNAQKKEQPNKPVAFKSVQAVPLSEATTAIHAYGDWLRSLNMADTTLIKVTRAFLIPGSDLVGVLQPTTGSMDVINQCNYKQARAYLGIDANNMIHLYLTPVNDDGVDVILTNPESGDQQVFDLTTPCPRTCDEASILYTAFN
ncbi:MAG: hypothetical protein V4590_07915 [Bacteroidota bacterium]